MEGEVGLEVDTQNIKMGDGSTAWNDLEYGVGYSNVTNDPGNNENLVISQKGVTELVKGTKDGMTASEYPTIKITDFSNGVTTTGTERSTEIMSNMNTWLNGVTFSTDSKLIGHCKICCDGRNGDVYNYVFSYSNKVGVQVLMGGFGIKSDGTIEYYNGYKTLCRTCSGGTWGEWSDSIDISKIDDNELNVEKLKTTELSFNSGFYLTRTGTLAEDSKGWYSSKIRVKTGDKFIYTGQSLYNNPCVYVLYDKNNAVLSYDNTSGKRYKDEIEITNENAYYIQFGSYDVNPFCLRIEDYEGAIQCTNKISDILNSIGGGIENIDYTSIASSGNYVDYSTGNLIYYSLYGITNDIFVSKGDIINFTDIICAANVAIISLYDKKTGIYTPQLEGKIDAKRDYSWTSEKECYIRICLKNTQDGGIITINRHPNLKKYISGVNINDVNFYDKISIINLFNKDAPGIIKDNYISWDGSTTSKSGYNISDFVPVENGKTYSFIAYPGFFGSNAARVITYDASKNKIGSILGTCEGQIAQVTINDESIKYVKFNVATESNSYTGNNYDYLDDRFMFVEGTEYPSTYYPYGDYYRRENNALMSISDEKQINSLYNKSVIFTGDSICNASSASDGKSGWAGRIGRNNNMSWQNKAIGGGTFTKNDEWSNFCISDTDFGNGADYIIIEGGTNDADRIGTDSALLGENDMTDFTSNFNNSTFCDALNYLFKRITNNYPNAKIGYIVAQKMTPVTTGYTKDTNNKRKFFEKAMEIAEKWGVSILNLWDNCPLNPSIPSYYTEGSSDNYYTDGQHLTSKGYDYITPKIEAWMKNL